jgi:hypothetical protein
LIFLENNLPNNSVLGERGMCSHDCLRNILGSAIWNPRMDLAIQSNNKIRNTFPMLGLNESIDFSAGTNFPLMKFSTTTTSIEY